MPPQSKFTKQEIIDNALEIVRSEGIDKITARELGKRLNSSARPIFTVFENMDELKQAVILQAKDLYRQYIAHGLQEELAFRGVGTAYISFAVKEPQLFRLLFMQPQDPEKNITQIMPLIDENYEKILQSVQKPYGLDQQAAQKLYQHLWIYTHGIATMCATNLCSYDMDEITIRMTEIFKSLLAEFKRGEI